MSLTLDETPEDAIETTGGWPDGVQFRFPRRDLGSARWLLLGVLLALGALLGRMIGGPIIAILQNGVAFGDAMSLVVWSLIAIPVCRLPIWYGLVLVFGRTEIDVRPASLSASECVGGWRRTRRWPLYRLMRVQVFDLLPASSASSVQFRSAIASAKGESREVPDSPQDVRSSFVRHLHALTALLDDSKRIILVLAYPKSLLEKFAQELAEQIARARNQLAEDGSAYETRLAGVDSEVATATRRTFGESQSSAPQPILAAPAIGLSELIGEAKEAIRKRIEPDVFDQPADSRVEVDWLDDGGVTFQIRPAGVWNGSAGAFPIGILLAIVTAGFTVLFAGVGAAGVWGAVGMMSVFWIISAALLIAGYITGTRESAVAVVGPSVMVMQTGLRRAKRREWPRSEVKTVRVGPSGTEINDRPVPELQLLDADDKKLFGMLVGRDVRELHWMATLLRQALKSKEPTGAEQSSCDQPQVSSEARVSPEESVPLAAAAPESEFNFDGMAIEERLRVAKLSDEFSEAIERRDRDTMLKLLARVQLPDAGAASFTDAVLSHARQRQV